MRIDEPTPRKTREKFRIIVIAPHEHSEVARLPRTVDVFHSAQLSWVCFGVPSCGFVQSRLIDDPDIPHLKCQSNLSALLTFPPLAIAVHGVQLPMSIPENSNDGATSLYHDVALTAVHCARRAMICPAW